MTHKAELSARLVWLVIVPIHFVCIVLYGCVALAYHILPDTVLCSCSRFTNAVCSSNIYDACTEALASTPSAESIGEASRIKVRSISTIQPLGFFGVGGKHFALLFLIREATETVLQSIQAYFLSVYAPRVWLNRLAVVAVTISCWSTPAIHRVFHRNPRLELILCLLFDIVLDFVSSVGLPIVFAALYGPAYDPVYTDFKLANWLDKVWVANMNNEFRLIFVQSWLDFVGRILFAVTLLMCLDDVKYLAASSKGINRTWRSGITESSHHAVAISARWSQRIETVAHTILIVWGVVILTLHLESSISSHDNVLGCMVQVHPWAYSRTACIYMDIDCANRQPVMAGNAAELEATWSEIDPRALRILIFRNCPTFHMPQSIRQFPQLTALYLYNLTVVEWSEAAALSRSYHPNMRQVTMTKVDMGVFANTSILPSGLLAPDFPQTLGTVFIYTCNVGDLPSNLDNIWPKGINMIFAANGATRVPTVFLRMQLIRLTLSYNRITELPPELFQIPSLQWLEVPNNPINEFPARVDTPSTTLKRLDFGSTNVSALPGWMTTQHFNQVDLHGAGTPFCKALVSKQNSSIAGKYGCAR
uniref:Leucine-rich repeat-containing N-terminal plant-type domain-containing protein n=1 Tax=Globisporangium ultimum (strain ATCC 200006 / CBS 805.95 / DAOM BR144) TaxID=431595 RepID=K3W5P5_GLOUD